MIKFSRFTKTIQTREFYVKKRIFKEFQPDNFRASVTEMPELAVIMQYRDVDTTATLLTAGLTRILEKMAPVRTIQSRQDYAPRTWGRRPSCCRATGTLPRRGRCGPGRLRTGGSTGPLGIRPQRA